MPKAALTISKTLLALTLWGLAVIAAPATEFEGINYEFNTTSRTATVIALENGRRYTGHVSVPEWVSTSKGSFRVTGIAMHAFYDCGDLKSVYLGPCVQEVGYEAFAWCTSLQLVRFGPEVLRVRTDAFLGCTGLEQVIAASEASWCAIDFDGDNGRSNPLYYAHQLSIKSSIVHNLVLPNGVVALKPYAFVNSDLNSVKINKDVSRVNMLAFANCRNLLTLRFPNGLTSIESSNDYGDLGQCFIETLILGDGLEMVPNGAFYHCASLQNVVFGKKLHHIGNMAFSGASGITQLELPNSVSHIGVQAFEQCTNLRSLTIGTGVTSIASRAFAGCGFLTRIYMYAPASQITVLGDDIFDGVNTSQCVLYVPQGQLAAYRSLRQFRKFDTILELSEPTLGDINGDGEVTVADLTMLIQIILYPDRQSPRILSRADINKDGEIGITDVVALVNILM